MFSRRSELRGWLRDKLGWDWIYSIVSGTLVAGAMAGIWVIVYTHCVGGR